LLYAVLGVPLAYLADRTSRSAVVAGSLAVWSGFTALCGVATGYWQLFLFRLGVGIGEAGGVAPSYALIADYFPSARRARALAIFSLGVPIGLGSGSFIGAYLAEWFGWRSAFLIMGIAGILLAPLIKYAVRDLPRPAPVTDAVPLMQVFPIVARKPTFWLMAFAASMSSLCGYGLAVWTPSVLIRSYHLDLITTGNFLASLLIIGGCTGVFMGGWLADRLGAMDKGWYAKLPTIAWLITAPTFALGLMVPSLWLAWPLLLIPNALNILWLGPVVTAVQHLVPQPMRATASASFLFINNLIGIGFGIFFLGFMSDAMVQAHGADSLRYSILYGLGFYLLSAALYFAASRRLPRDWHR